MTWDKLDTDRIEQIVRQITGKKIDKTKKLINKDFVIAAIKLKKSLICNLDTKA